MEKVKTAAPKVTQSPSGGSGFDSAGGNGEMKSATVMSGPYTDSLPVAGMSVEKVRKRYADKFDIHPQATAILDGEEVGPATVIGEGQTLMFVRKAGEKGFGEALVVEGETIRATSPEGVVTEIPIADFLARVAPPKIDTGGVILAPGVIQSASRGGYTIWVHQQPPRIVSYKWIEANSPAPYGSGANFRDVQLLLPYTVVIAVFGPNGLMGSNECFFSNSPIRSTDDKLYYPALLNCSKFPGDPKTNKSPLSWICTQHLKLPQVKKDEDKSISMRNKLQALLHCLHETGFNLSSEVNEGASWFGISCKKIKEVATVEKWAERTKQGMEEGDNLWILDVEWLDTGYTLGQVVERSFAIHNANKEALKSVGDLAKYIYNAK